MIENAACLVLTTCANEKAAEYIAKTLVNNKLVACVNIFPRVRSIYIWDEQLQDDQEHLLIMKSTASKFSAIQSWCDDNHPYEVPELIQVDISSGSPAYLQWISDTLGK